MLETELFFTKHDLDRLSQMISALQHHIEMIMISLEF